MHSFPPRVLGADGLAIAEREFIQSLWFPHMNTRYQNLTTPADKTCNWLFEDDIYTGWFTGLSRNYFKGLLELKGKPGSGKSVLMKEAYRRTLQQLAGPGC